MALADRIKTAQRNESNRQGCRTCLFINALPAGTKQLINDWLADPKASRAQLYEILSHPEEDNHLNVSLSGWRLHLRHHDERCR